MVSKVNIGQLVDFDWKVSMTCSSNLCKNLDTPLVTVKFHLKDESDNAYCKTTEMNLAEFQVDFLLLYLLYEYTEYTDSFLWNMGQVIVILPTSIYL